MPVIGQRMTDQRYQNPPPQVKATPPGRQIPAPSAGDGRV